MRDKEKEEKKVQKPDAHTHTRGPRRNLPITKTKKETLPHPSWPSPATHSPCFSSLPTNWSHPMITPRFTSRSLVTPTMFSSIPVLFVYPYMPFFVLLFSWYMLCECCARVRHLCCFLSRLRLLPWGLFHVAAPGKPGQGQAKLLDARMLFDFALKR
jgi:hypothetical protein